MAKAKKDKTSLVTGNTSAIDDKRVVEIIENRKFRAASYANSEVTLMFWEVGKYIGSVLLDGERAKYGRKIVATLSQQLMERYGTIFERTKITRRIEG
ncbi:MAG: DUF1016 N-terminal domain-containing protein [Oscillospiraceae bacterium]|jgi:hypothetical protein|nr:DUF1016 N-terminal domain-containing protein [Oscillospiraceae bacterium]